MKNLSLLLCLFLQLQVTAQAPRKLKQDPRFELKIERPSLVISPSPMDSSTKHPLVVFLPFTGGTAKDYYDIYLSQVPTLFGEDDKNKAFIALIPDGAGSTKDHSWEGFEACIYRYENRILSDIDSLSRIYNIDQSKIILAGFSLGGDLGWAISQRYPEKFKGAIVNGSRCGYGEKGMKQRQAKQGVRYCIAMGEQESEARMNGAKAAVAALDNAGIKNKFFVIPNAEHAPATIEQFKEALNFILFE